MSFFLISNLPNMFLNYVFEVEVFDASWLSDFDFEFVVLNFDFL